MATANRAADVFVHVLLTVAFCVVFPIVENHFLEGLARDWSDVQIQTDTKTKKFRSYPTPFATRDGAVDAFTALFKRYANSIIIVSYSSNSLPTKDEMVSLMSKYKNHVDVVPIDYRYNFGNRSDGCVKRQNVKEYLFIGY